jgi:lipopolysaccharide export LptBFGC system permease protein LptF
MWKIHRYYLKEVTVSLLITFVVLFGVVLISLVYRGIQRAQGFGLLAAAKTTFFWTADTLPHLLPISLLFATVLTFARASQDREITAIRGAGISPRVAMTSALLVGVVCSLIGSWALHYAVPKAHFRKYRVIAESIRSVLLDTGMMTDKFQFGELVMTWERKNEADHWENVYIHLDRRHSGLGGPLPDGRVFLADEAWPEIDEESLTMVARGLRQPGADFGVPGETRISIDLRSITEPRRRDEDDKDLGSDQLLAEIYRGVHENPNGARFTVHRRGCWALLPCLFAPIGFCIGVMSRSRGRMLALVFSMVPVFVFYLTDFFSAKLVRVFDFPMLGWLPAVVLLVLGVPFCWRLLGQ